MSPILRSNMTKDELKIVFLGTPEFAVPSLDMLLDEGYNVIACITQPDRPKGRGHKLAPPPVKEAAQRHGIPVYQFEKLSREGVDALSELKPDLMITAAFGQILSREVLAIPPLGCINVHASLLPEYRGAAPIEMAVINGETRTGITTMYTVYELDAGDILEQDAIDIPENITGGQLREQLSHLGARTLKRTLEKLMDGSLKRTPQNPALATYYPMFKKGFGEINWRASAVSIANLVRGCNPAPIAYTYCGEDKVKILEVSPCGIAGAANPGDILLCDAKKGLYIQAGEGAVEITKLQFPGKKPMSAKDYLRGRSIDVKRMGRDDS